MRSRVIDRSDFQLIDGSLLFCFVLFFLFFSVLFSIGFVTVVVVVHRLRPRPAPGALTTSQFPVFTLYVQKNCLKITPSADPAESVTDGRGALRINLSGQRNAARPGQKPASFRAEPVGANTVCSRAWSFERVQGYELDTLPKRRRRVASRQACEELCLGEREFTCRSVSFSKKKLFKKISTE